MQYTRRIESFTGGTQRMRWKTSASSLRLKFLVFENAACIIYRLGVGLGENVCPHDTSITNAAILVVLRLGHARRAVRSQVPPQILAFVGVGVMAVCDALKIRQPLLSKGFRHHWASGARAQFVICCSLGHHFSLQTRTCFVSTHTTVSKIFK